MFNAYAPNESFTASERVDLFVHMIASLVPDLQAYLLLIIVVDLQRPPLWMDMVLPKGRTLHACQIVFEEMRRSMLPGLIRPYLPFTPYANITPVTTHTSDPLIATRRPLRSRPSIIRATDSSYPSVINGESPTYARGALLDSPEQSEKRGRQTKAEAAECDKTYAERGQTYQPKKRSVKRMRPSIGPDTRPLKDEDITAPLLRTPRARITTPVKETSTTDRRSCQQPHSISPLLIPSAGADVSTPELEQELEVNTAKSLPSRMLK